MVIEPRLKKLTSMIMNPHQYTEWRICLISKFSCPEKIETLLPTVSIVS